MLVCVKHALRGCRERLLSLSSLLSEMNRYREEQEDRTMNLVLQITPLEREALRLLSDGVTARDLSGSLNLTPLETELLVTRLFAALGARTRAQAIDRGRKRGLLLTSE